MHGGLQWVGALRFQLLHVCSASSLCWPSLVSQTGNPTKLKKLPHIHILPSSLITQAQRPQQVVSGGNAHDVPRMTRRNQRLDDTHLLVPELTYSIRPLEVWQQGCWSATAKLTTTTSTNPFHDRDDLDEPFPIAIPDQRQQRSLPSKPPTPPSPPAVARSATPASSHRRLRRTPNFLATPSPRPEQQQSLRSPSRVIVTLGPTGRYVLADEAAGRKQRPSPPKATRQLSQGNLSSSSVATSASFSRRVTDSNLETSEPKSHSVLRISKKTHNAILYALEATLRGPNTISIDPVECYSQMADLMGGRGPVTSNGNGTPSVRATSGRPAVGSPAGIRSPKVIMQQRAAREKERERKREEQARLQREEQEQLQQEQEARLQEAERQTEHRAPEKAVERRPTAAGAGSSTTGADPSTSRQPAQSIPNRPNADNGGRTARTSGIPATVQAHASQSTRNEIPFRAPPRTSVPPSGPSATGATAGGPSGSQSQPGEFTMGRGRNSFPHAFERWETLSAHWEGLTSFWIRRLEQNSSEIQGDPIAQQLARQVTDLSSAGANLFHAVVELQRLRASSERKFQRWFFETRSELERNQEMTAMLEAALDEERRNRTDAIRQAVEQEQGSKLHKQLAEMRKELTISKEEARRAWEELGRREKDERDRLKSLQQGQPTLVGGVQVVPMNQGVSRGNTQREPRYVQPEMPEYTRSHTPRAARPEYTQAPAVQPVPVSSSGPNPAFQTPSSVHHQQSYASEGAMSEEEFETPATQPSAYHAPVSIPQQSQYSSAPDYTGSGYSAVGWEEIPQHHHPTRLSDVLEEEEERSRTSASQRSRH
ncbi:hypothetical protein F4824DRAFT_486904 [Ustulina deusta]|nr:hypothetical protein F4824DRAFT_486904 [Ustulina deusta]